MSMTRPRAAVALAFTLALLAISYGGFAYLELNRGLQVYPGGSLQWLLGVCLAVAAVASGAAVWLGFRHRPALMSREAAETPPEAAVTRPNRWSTLILTCVALLFTATTVQHSRVSGKLAFPPFYDDVGYFLDGLHRVHAFYDGGVSAVIRQYRAGPPHSPTSSLLAAAGYLTLGTDDWVPPLMNFLLVLGVLLFVRSQTRKLTGAWAVPVYAFALAWPFVFLAVVHCIPDYTWALSLAMAGWLAMEKPLTQRSPWSQFGVGLLFGLSFLSKPASFAVTGFILAAALFLIVTVEFVEGGLSGLAKRIAAPLLRLLAGCLALCGPHFAVAYKGVWAYFMVNVMGPQKDLWKYHGTARQQLLYYITGDGGAYQMGGMLILWVVLGVLAIVCAVILRKRHCIVPAAAAALLFLFAHAAVSVTSYKQVFLGCVIPAAFLISGIVMLSDSLADAQRLQPGRRACLLRSACLVVVALALFQFRPQPLRSILAHRFADYPRSGVDFIREGNHRRMVVSRIVSVVSSDPRPHVAVGWVRANVYNLAFVFLFQFQKDRTKTVDCVELAGYPGDTNRFRAEIGAVDYLFYLSAGDSDEKQFLNSLRALGSWKVVERIDDPFDGGAILLMGKTVDWQNLNLGMTQVEGFSPLEGPYAPTTYKVRWGLGPHSSIHFSSDQATKLTLQIEANTVHPRQRINFLLDGAPIGSAAVTQGDFQTIQVLFDVSAGMHTLELDYATWPVGTDQRPLAVLFRKLSFSEVSRK